MGQSFVVTFLNNNFYSKYLTVRREKEKEEDNLEIYPCVLI